MSMHSPEESRVALIGGAIAGFVGGVVLSLFVTAMSLAGGEDIWVGLKAAATPFLGGRALQPGFDPGAVALGMMSHFAVSIVWGVLFAVFAYGFGLGLTVALGITWGLIVWMAMYYCILPIIGAGAVAASIPVDLAILNHVLFGAATAIAFLPFQHTNHHLARRRYSHAQVRL